MRYNYICYDCKNKITEEVGREPTSEELLGTEDTPGAVFETCHGMSADEDEIYEASECPMCDSHNTEKTQLGANAAYVYSKGYGWLDRRGIKRDMNLCKLTEDDPYKQYRVAGEVDDLTTRLKKGPQTKQKIFDTKPKSSDDS